MKGSKLIHFFADKRLLSRKNLTKMSDAFTRFGFDSMILAVRPDNKKANTCMIVSGEELHSKEDEYLLLHRLLSLLKSILKEKNIDFDFSITLKNAKKRKTKKEVNG